jgi:glycosyltransferase involved in cell wall biosynthesis
VTATLSNRSVDQLNREISISVIVPVRNGSGVLPRCLEALTSSKYPYFEVIVVDDCSSDDTPTIVERMGARYLRTPRNIGPAGARNLGSRQAQGGILAFIDADVVLPPEGLSLIAEAFAGNSKVTAVFGSYNDQPAVDAFVSQYKNLMHHYVHQSASETAATFWAGCGAIRKSAFDQVGGFDEVTYPAPSVEDIALGYKLINQGHRILIDKRLQVTHLKRWTTLSLLRADIFERAVPWARLILKSRQLPRDLNLNYTSRISTVLVCLLVGFCISLLSALWIGWSRLFLPLATAIAAICLSLLLLNADLYRFFWQKRGAWFAGRCILVHWTYYFYSGVTFVLVLAAHLVAPTPLTPPACNRRRESFPGRDRE